MIHAPTATAGILLASLLSAPPADIPWAPTLEAAREQATAEGKVLFIAVHMPGEAANERMARTIYTDRAITKLAEQTVNVLALAMDRYASEGTRVDLGGLTDDQLKRLDMDIRAEILQPDTDGFVVAPQHVFLNPAGEVLFSVPYEVTRGELEWCLLEAIRTVDPEAELRPSAGVRPPKRLIKAGVIQGSDESIGAIPATLEEVRALIKEANKGRKYGSKGGVLRILTADEEEAREYITKELRSGGRRGEEKMAGTLSNIQRRSPASWWEVVIEFADHSSPAIREEVAACLEVLAAPEALRELKKALTKEKDPRLEGMWLRAQASCGAGDSKVRKATLKAAESSKDPSTRSNATFALGYLAPGEDVSEHLVAVLKDEDEHIGVQTAAICAMALTRDASFVDILRPVSEATSQLKAVAVAALKTLEEGDLKPLGAHVRRACGDKVPRERLFGR